jgi:hypothetical protein
MKEAIYLALALSGVLLLQGCSTQKPKITAEQARAYFEEFRADFNGAKVRNLNEVMKLSVQEADKFWPIYRSYQLELAPISDRKLAIIRQFLTYRKAGTLTDDRARELSAQWLQTLQDRLDLWKKYASQLQQELSPLRAAQFLQVENQMALVVDISIASEMPMLGSKPETQP